MAASRWRWIVLLVLVANECLILCLSPPKQAAMEAVALSVEAESHEIRNGPADVDLASESSAVTSERHAQGCGEDGHPQNCAASGVDPNSDNETNSASGTAVESRRHRREETENEENFEHASYTENDSDRLSMLFGGYMDEKTFFRQNCLRDINERATEAARALKSVREVLQEFNKTEPDLLDFAVERMVEMLSNENLNVTMTERGVTFTASRTYVNEYAGIYKALIALSIIWLLLLVLILLIWGEMVVRWMIRVRRPLWLWRHLSSISSSGGSIGIHNDAGMVTAEIRDESSVVRNAPTSSASREGKDTSSSPAMKAE